MNELELVRLKRSLKDFEPDSMLTQGGAVSCQASKGAFEYRDFELFKLGDHYIPFECMPAVGFHCLRSSEVSTLPNDDLQKLYRKDLLKYRAVCKELFIDDSLIIKDSPFILDGLKRYDSFDLAFDAIRHAITEQVFLHDDDEYNAWRKQTKIGCVQSELNMIEKAKSLQAGIHQSTLQKKSIHCEKTLTALLGRPHLELV